MLGAVSLQPFLPNTLASILARKPCLCRTMTRGRGPLQRGTSPQRPTVVAQKTLCPSRVRSRRAGGHTAAGPVEQALPGAMPWWAAAVKGEKGPPPPAPGPPGTEEEEVGGVEEEDEEEEEEEAGEMMAAKAAAFPAVTAAAAAALLEEEEEENPPEEEAARA
ncbi:hypothetical protein ACOMHN_064168 [Nucella lapillus]